MRVLIISDIHGNLPALEHVLDKERSRDMLISLGDVVNYGPWSNECVDLMDTVQNKVLIIGNHEEAYIEGKYPGSNIVAQTFFEVCYPQFSKIDKIKTYIESCVFNNTLFAHTLNNKYIFSDTEVELQQDTFIGHSHRIFSKSLNGYRLVNPGSVGQNRVNIDEINYAVWDTGTNTIDLVKEPFSADVLLNEMKHRNYPQLCIDYIASKRSK